MQRIAYTLLLATLFLTAALAARAQQQTAEPIRIPARTGPEDRPQTINETLYKLRVEQEKKEHGQMLSRGEEALRITEAIEKEFEEKGRLTSDEVSKVANIEKLVKRIRSELGGDDEDDKQSEGDASKPVSPGEAVKSLKELTRNLCNELKKTTRFTISLTAIQASNAVLRVTRLIRSK